MLSKQNRADATDAWSTQQQHQNPKQDGQSEMSYAAFYDVVIAEWPSDQYH